ncbi:MAG: hypothetical protein ACWGQW_16730, partial [bacterium]
MSRELPHQKPAVNLSEPITSGLETCDVRYTLPYRKQQYLNEQRQESAAACERAGGHAPGRACASADSYEQAKAIDGATQLVYSSIFHTTCKDRAERIELYPVTARLVRPKLEGREDPTPPDRTGTEIKGFSQKSRAR